MCSPACFQPQDGVTAIAAATPPPIVLWPWPWLEWIDCPWPLQVWWRVRYGIPMDTYKGCGCLLRLRQFTDRMARALWGPVLAEG